MNQQTRSSGSGNHDLFENVQDLRRRLQETERNLYTLNVQERAVEGTCHQVIPSNQQKIPPLRLEEVTGDDSVEIQNILGASSHRSDGSSPRAIKGHHKTSKGDRPATYGSTQQLKPQYYQEKQQHDQNQAVSEINRRTLGHDTQKLQKSGFPAQEGYASPRASRKTVNSTSFSQRPNVEGYLETHVLPTTNETRQVQDRRQMRSHDGARSHDTARSHDFGTRQNIHTERSVTDMRDVKDGAQVGYISDNRNYQRIQRDGKSRSNSTQDLLYQGVVGVGGEEGNLDSARGQLTDTGRSRSFQNLSQRSAISGVSDINQEVIAVNDSSFDVTSLRHKIHHLREENAKLVSQNHKLLNQLEDVGFERKTAVTEIESLRSEVKKQARRSEELQEQLFCLQSGNDSHEKALRASEERCEDFERDVGELESLLTEYKSQVSSMEQQMADQENTLARYESERNKSLDTAEEIQRAYEEHQKRAQEKLRKAETNEEHYKEKLRSVDEQRGQLIQELEAYKSQLRELAEQVRVVQDDSRIEKESRDEAEQHNLQLRSQVALLQQKCAQLEQTVRVQESVERENEGLKRSVCEHKARLEQCQVQIGESQAELQRLEQVARGMQNNQGAPDRDLNGSYLDTFENENQEATVAELRHELEAREEEVSRLQAVVNKYKSEGSQSDTQESLRRQLRGAGDKHKQAEQRIEELESLLLRLEEERTSMLKKLANQEQALSDLKITSDSLDTKLTHRNSQVVELQREVDQRLQEASRLERELRKKTSQMSSLERQLDSKVTEVSDQVTKVSDLEEELEAKSAMVQQLKSSVDEKTREFVQSQSMAQKLKSIHMEQCKELEKQIELLERRFQEKEGLMKEQGGMIERLRGEILQKDATLNNAVRKAQAEIERKCLESDAALKAFERKSDEATQRVKQLESALVVCKEELNVYVEQYQDTKTRHELELTDRECKIGELEQQLGECRSALGERQVEVEELETSLKDRLVMVEQGAARIAELEEGQGAMVTQVSSLEQQLLSERSRLEGDRLTMEKEVKVMEGKLQQACVEVESKNTEIQELLNSLSDLELEKQAVADEVSDLERQLGQEKTDSDSRLTQLQEAQRELRQLRGQVKDRQEKVEDLTESVKRHKQDMNEKTMEMRKLMGEFKQLKAEQQVLSNQCAESEQEVDALNMEIGDKNRILEEHRLTIRRKEDEVRSKVREMEELERALEERNWELRQRAAQLTQIDAEVREHKTDMDQRHVRLEAQLKQAKLETQHKDKQLADLDDRLRESQEEVREKSLQLQQSEQNNRKLRLEVENHAAQSQDIEMQVYTLKHRLESSLTENTELGQELKTAREEIQKIHYELTESRREFLANKRELEKHRKENQEVKQKLEGSENSVKTLSSELTVSRAQGERLEGQTDVEMRKLVTEVDAMRDRHVTEIKSLTAKLAAKSDAETSRDAEMEELRLRQTQLQRRAEEGERQAGHYEGQLEACKRLVEQLQQGMEQKNNELSRMKGRLVGYENMSSVSSNTTSLNTNVGASQNMGGATGGVNQFMGGANSGVTHPPTQTPHTGYQADTQTQHSGYQSTTQNAHSGYQSTVLTDTLDSLGHLGSTQDTRTRSFQEPSQTNVVNSNLLPNPNLAQPVQQETGPVKMRGMSQSSAYGEHLMLRAANERPSMDGPPLMSQQQGVSGSDLPGQDDSIVSLLNRMQMHERNVQDMLQARLSTGVSDEHPTAVNQHGGAANEGLGGAYVGLHQNVRGANMEGSQNVGGATGGVNQFMGGANSGVNQQDSGAMLQGSDLAMSSLAVEGGNCYQSGISSSSSGRGTLMGSDPGAVNSEQLADYLASDPGSFQAMFKKLKDSYTSSGSNTLENIQESLHNPAPLDSHVDSQYLSSQKQLIPTRDDQIPQAATNILQQHGHQGHKPFKQGADISVLSSISESDSLKSALSKKSKGSSHLGSHQYTSSPKTSKHGKKSVRISAPPQTKAGANKFTAKNPTGTKTTKKGTAASSAGNNTKKAAKTGQSGPSQTAQKPSRFGALVAKGLANIEAAAHPNKKVPKSPGESEPSPNVSTAISHYATDIDQSHGGSFLSTDQSL